MLRTIYSRCESREKGEFKSTDHGTTPQITVIQHNHGQFRSIFRHRSRAGAAQEVGLAVATEHAHQTLEFRPSTERRQYDHRSTNWPECRSISFVHLHEIEEVQAESSRSSNRCRHGDCAINTCWRRNVSFNGVKCQPHASWTTDEDEAPGQYVWI